MQSSSQKFDPLGFALGFLMFLGIIGEGFSPKFISIHSTPYHLIQLGFFCFASLYWLYSGNKKFRQRREQQEAVHWYTQPGILFAIGGFFIIPYFVLQVIFGDAALNTLPLPLEIALDGPAGVCVLASIFFYFRGLRRRKKDS